MMDEKELSLLRASVRERVGERRFSHILGVERLAVKLGRALIPDRVNELRCAAILHDVSKRIPKDEQIKLLDSAGFELTDEDIETDGVLHSFSGPIVIKRDFPKLAIPDVLRAVENHTVGRAGMTVFEKIIFVSDYAEDTREYSSCIAVREKLLSGFDALSNEEKLKRLDEACIGAIDGAIEALYRMGKPINSRIFATKNYLLKK